MAAVLCNRSLAFQFFRCLDDCKWPSRHAEGTPIDVSDALRRRRSRLGRPFYIVLLPVVADTWSALDDPLQPVAIFGSSGWSTQEAVVRGSGREIRAKGQQSFAGRAYRQARCGRLNVSIQKPRTDAA